MPLVVDAKKFPAFLKIVTGCESLLYAVLSIEQLALAQMSEALVAKELILLELALFTSIGRAVERSPHQAEARDLGLVFLFGTQRVRVRFRRWEAC